MSFLSNMSKKKRFGFALTYVGLVILLVNSYFIYEEQQLLQNPVKTTAKVIRKDISTNYSGGSRSNRYILEVAYQTDSGKYMEATESVSKKVWNLIKVNTIIPIYYSSDNSGNISIGEDLPEPLHNNPIIIALFLLSSISVLYGMFLFFKK